MKASQPGKKTEPWILGVSASHNGSACLLKGNRIVVAIQEERLTRIKRDRIYGAVPSLSVAYCLACAGIDTADLDLIAIAVQGEAGSANQDPYKNPQFQVTGRKIPIKIVSHHLAHAASAFGASGLPAAAVLVVDGLGSPVADISQSEKRCILNHKENGWESVSLYRFDGLKITPLEKQMAKDGKWLLKEDKGMPCFRTLGGMYASAARQIFGNPMEAGKVMGLAPFGKPVFKTRDFFSIKNGIFTFSDKVPALFTSDKRWPDSKKSYSDLAASVQHALESALFYLTDRLYEKTGMENMCFAGGVALNAIANEKIINRSPFSKVFIVPSADDSGTAVGAAYLGLWGLTGVHLPEEVKTDCFGIKYTSSQIKKVLSGNPYIVAKQSSQFADEITDRLCAGQIGGWFQGGAEFGPRALGNRSIICDPRRGEAKSIINDRIKERESFRPFAPAILADKIDHWFHLSNQQKASPFMLRVIDFKPEVIPLIPAVVHPPGNGRVQTVTRENGPFYRLLKKFDKKTAIPVLLNTSFNLKNEPIAETPDDALWSFLGSPLDFCVINNYILDKQTTYRNLLDVTPLAVPHQYRMVDTPVKTKQQQPVFETERHTPWGTTLIKVPAHFLIILSFINGKRNGWKILDQVRKNSAGKGDDQWLTDCLRAMRGLGIIQFKF